MSGYIFELKNFSFIIKNTNLCESQKSQKQIAIKNKCEYYTPTFHFPNDLIIIDFYRLNFLIELYIA